METERMSSEHPRYGLRAQADDAERRTASDDANGATIQAAIEAELRRAGVDEAELAHLAVVAMEHWQSTQATAVANPSDQVTMGMHALWRDRLRHSF